MEEYLAFVDFIGRTVDGKYIYRMDFTTDTDVVWGEFFNITPAAIVPNLQPDKNTLSHSGKAIFPREMMVAKKNYCFSMQDCIDGIIPLMFSEIDEHTLELDDKPLYFSFAEEREKVEDKLNKLGIELYDVETVEHGNDDAIDSLIDSMDDENNEEDVDE